MIKYSANILFKNIFLCVGASTALTVMLCVQSHAAERDASFLPPTATGQTRNATPETTAATDSKGPVILPPAQLPFLAPPSKNKQDQTQNEVLTVTSSPPPGTASGTTLPSKDTSQPSAAPASQEPDVLTVTTAPVPLKATTSPVAPKPSTPAVAKPAAIAKPVTSEPLAAVDPDTLGLLSPEVGGLGASMWENTPRAVVEKLLPEINLPTASPTLNSLARRLLLTAAATPVGAAGLSRTLTSVRLEKLLALGDVPEAWQLAMLAKPGRIDAITMRQVTEAVLIGPDSKDLCAKIPEIMSDAKSEEWQKALLLCQLRGGDPKAAGLSLDVMREQQVRDDVFIMLAARALSGGGSRLPRQLTPLRPLTLGVLRQIDAPLPPDLYARPDAVLIPELLLTKAEDEVLRLALAEKAAARGIISAAQLAAVYDSAALTPEAINSALSGNETGPRYRTLLYRAAAKEQAPAKRAEVIAKLVQSADPLFLAGAGGQALAEMAASIPAVAETNAYAAAMARLFAMAGKPDKALEWIKLANEAGKTLPNVAAEMQANWPLFVLSGLVTDAEYGAGIKNWLNAMLEGADKKTTEGRLRRQKTGNALMLFSAAGFAVPEDAWPRVMEVEVEGRRVQLPSPVLLERLQSAGQANRKGETVLLGIVLAGSGANDTAPFVLIETVRALRLAGFTADALSLAREAIISAQ